MREGSFVYLEENGVAVPYLVAKHNYEPTYNENRTMLVRKYANGTTSVWGAAYTDKWNNSTLFATLQEHLSRFSEKLQAAIGSTSYEYTETGTTVGVMSSAIFSPSVNELAGAGNYSNNEGTLIASLEAVLDYFDESGANRAYWTRSACKSQSSSYSANYITSAAAVARAKFSTAYYMMVALSLPGDMFIDKDTMSVREELL